MLLPGLLLLSAAVAAAASGDVSPAENVTVVCQNTQVTLYWNYGQEQPDTTFRLTHGADGDSKVIGQTQERRYDLSRVTWQRYMAVHHVRLTAERGNLSSQTAESPTFTFNDLRTAFVKCKLELPPVTLSVKDSNAAVSFANPLHIYKELWDLRHDKPSLVFRVFLDGVEQDAAECGPEEAMCGDQIFYNHSRDGCCVRLEGQMFHSSGFTATVLFRDTELICAHQEPEDSYLMVLAVVLSLFVAVIIMVTLTICKVKAWNMSSPTPPKCLEPLLPTHDMKVLNVNQSQSSSCTLEPANHKPDCGPTLGETSCPVYMEGGVSESGSQRSDDGELAWESSPEKENATMDSDSEEEPSAYDCPQRLEDMGDGDMVKCYGGISPGMFR